MPLLFLSLLPVLCPELLNLRTRRMRSIAPVAIHNPLTFWGECESGFGTVIRNECHQAVREDSHYFCTFAQILKVRP